MNEIQEKKDKVRLYEVDFMRIFLIIVLLMDHSFAPFSGIWIPVSGQIEIPSYRFISLLSSSLFLQIFVFISGYVYGMKCRITSSFNVKSEILKKFKRLFIPSVFFSLIYFALFEDKHLPIQNIIYMIINGCGHMWFLPMLFWCFVIVIFIEHFNVKPMVVLLLSFIASLMSFIPLPLRLSQSVYYFVFFYLGFAINRYGVELKRISNLFVAIASAFLFLLCFISTTQVRITGFDESQLYSHASRIIVDNLVRIVYVVFGLLSLYLFSVFLSNKLSETVKKTITTIAGYCFGIYLYQQFFLKYLYYYVYDQTLSIYLLPWIGFFVAGLGSALLTYLTLKLPIGRKLIG